MQSIINDGFWGRMFHATATVVATPDTTLNATSRGKAISRVRAQGLSENRYRRVSHVLYRNANSLKSNECVHKQ